MPHHQKIRFPFLFIIKKAMSSLSASDILISEILTILCQNNSLWGRCCFPDYLEGTPEATLLTSLQTQFPNSPWIAMPTLLANTLAMARRLGLIKQIAGSWFIFQNFVAINPPNIRFTPFCPGKICGLPPCEREVGCCN